MLDIPKDPSLSHRIYETIVTEIYRKELSAGDVFIDLGANVGHHTWQMAQVVGSEGRGFAIEPVPDFAERVRNVLKHKSVDWVEVVNVAAADYAGECSFFVQPEHIGWSSMFSDHVHPSDDAQDSNEITVPVARLDDVVSPPDGKALSVIKVDVENAEFAALRGTQELIRAHQPAIVFENNPREAARRNDYSVEDFFDFFAGLGYELWSFHSQKMEDAQQWFGCPSSYYLATASELADASDFIARYELEDVVERVREKAGKS